MIDLDRRTLLGGGAVLLVGFMLEGRARAQPTKPASPKPGTKELNAYIRIGEDGVVTMILPESEMGQGITTSLPMILAEELEVDLASIRTETALADQTKYGRQITGGSSSVREGYPTLRKAGAAARTMLIAAAADAWKVPAAECRAENGAVLHDGSKKRATYGELAVSAAKQQAPESPVLKEKSAFRLIGKPTKRLDSRAKVTGTATFGIDVKVPGMLTARVVRPPVFGAKVKSFDAKEAKKVPGVRAVLQIPSGVAVVADHFWAAKVGSEKLSVEWDEGEFSKISNATISAKLKELVKGGIDAKKNGDAILAISKAAKKIEGAAYEVPYLAHATMEPLNATADVRKDRVEIWAPTQAQSSTLQAAAKITGLPPEKIIVHTTFLGGGFGRKAQTDFAEEAINLSMAMKKPVKVLWTREDDMTGGWYRPTAYNEMSGALDAQGWPIAWAHRIASSSILSNFGPLKDGLDKTAIEGAENLPYSIPNMHVTWAKADFPVSVWFWRSVGSSINAYVTECFLDELCALGGKDPLEVRRRLLDKKPRHKRVLEIAAEKAGWGKPLASGRARGLAVHESFGSIVAEVAEVSLGDGGVPRVHRVVCAVDSGDVVNPQTIVAQMESGIAYGLTAALYGAVHIENGRAVESNFDRYRVLRLDEMPEIETHVVPSGDAMGGIGEPGTPPIAPAVANAIFALTKKPVRRLPIVG